MRKVTRAGGENPDNCLLSTESRIYGIDKVWNFFAAAITDNKLHHAYIISGPASTGKATFARRLAKTLLSIRDDITLSQYNTSSMSKNAELSILAMTPEVAKLVNKLQHPDLLHISSECIYNSFTQKEKVGITIDEIRLAQAFLQTTPGCGTRKMLMIDGAEHLNLNASNGLLKLLEEPTAYTCIILVTSKLATILPTVRSRCCIIKTQALAYSDFCSILREKVKDFQLGNTELEAIFRLSGGNMGIALKLCSNNILALVQSIQKFYSVPMSERDSIKLLYEILDNSVLKDNFALLKNVLPRIIVGNIKDKIQLPASEIQKDLRYLTNLQSLLYDAENAYLNPSTVLFSILVHNPRIIDEE
ncbi:hypothetical protein MIDIC_70058 [Alphaproteobacteria bacterium]